MSNDKPALLGGFSKAIECLLMTVVGCLVGWAIASNQLINSLREEVSTLNGWVSKLEKKVKELEEKK